MLRLTPRQRAFLADKVLDVANLIAGAFVIGFFLGESRASPGVLLAGFAVWTVAVVFALMITRR